MLSAQNASANPLLRFVPPPFDRVIVECNLRHLRDQSRLETSPLARETNDQLRAYGHSLPDGEVAVLWDASTGYEWWAVFQHAPQIAGRNKLIRLNLPMECSPAMRQRLITPRVPTLEDILRYNTRPMTNQEAEDYSRKHEEREENFKRIKMEEFEEKAAAGYEQAIVDAEKGKFTPKVTVGGMAPVEAPPDFFPPEDSGEVVVAEAPEGGIAREKPLLQRFREMIEVSGRPYQQIAEEFGVTPQTIKNWENKGFPKSRESEVAAVVGAFEAYNAEEEEVS